MRCLFSIKSRLVRQASRIYIIITGQVPVDLRFYIEGLQPQREAKSG